MGSGVSSLWHFPMFPLGFEFGRPPDRTRGLLRPSNQVTSMTGFGPSAVGAMPDAETIEAVEREARHTGAIRSRLLTGQASQTGWCAKGLAALRRLLRGGVASRADGPGQRTASLSTRVRAATEACRLGDDATDRLVRSWLEDADTDADWVWPGGRRCGLVITHDVNARHRHAGIRRLRRVDERLGLKATYAVVGSWLDAYDRLLRSLIRADHDLALHGLTHDSRSATRTVEAVADDLGPHARDLRRIGIRGYRSPAWQVSPNLWSGLDEAGFLYDMSALDVWPFFDDDGLHGVHTFMPFMVEDLVVLPTTVPFELPWAQGWGVRDTLAFWRDKIDRIAHRGGLLLVSASPEAWLTGNRQAAAAYERVLTYILESHHPACMTACQAALHVKTQVIRGAMADVPGAPRLRVPCPKQVVLGRRRRTRCGIRDRARAAARRDPLRSPLQAALGATVM